MKEKRTEKRFPLLAGTEIVSCSMTNKDCLNVDIMNLSPGGIGISSVNRLHEGDVIELEVKVPGDDIPLFVKGEVVWVKQDNSKSDMYKAGIKLTKMEAADKKRLIKFLHKGNPYL